MFYYKKNILFDLDGTILDSYDGIISALVDTLIYFGHEAPAQDSLSWSIGPPLEDIYNILLPNQDKLYINKLIEYNRKIYGEKSILKCKLFAGMRELIIELAAKKSLYIATAKPQIFAQTILKNLGVDQYFKHIYGSGIDGSLENKTDLLAYILKDANINQDDSLLVGDTKYDIIAAKNNNLGVIAVKWGYSEIDDFDKYRPSSICESIEELKKLLI